MNCPLCQKARELLRKMGFNVPLSPSTPKQMPPWNPGQPK